MYCSLLYFWCRNALYQVLVFYLTGGPPCPILPYRYQQLERPALPPDQLGEGKRMQYSPVWSYEYPRQGPVLVLFYCFYCYCSSAAVCRLHVLLECLWTGRLFCDGFFVASLGHIAGLFREHLLQSWKQQRLWLVRQ